MNKIRLAIVAMVAGLLGLVAVAPAQAGDYAPTIPGGGGTIVVAPGGTFTLTFQSSKPCTRWTVTFNGSAFNGPAGSSYSPTLTAPTVAGDYPGVASCFYETTAAPAAFGSDSLLAVEASESTPFTVTISAGKGASESGVLPATGSDSDWQLFAVAGGAVVVGAGVLLIARRKKSDA